MHEFRWWRRKKDEVSELNPKLPRYHKGYDIDKLMEKWKNKEEMTEDEVDAFDEVIRNYYNQEYERRKDDTGLMEPLIIYGTVIYPSGTVIDPRPIDVCRTSRRHDE